MEDSSVRWVFIFFSLTCILYCIPEYCRLKYFPINLSPVNSALSWGCPRAAACATSQGRYAQVDSLLRVSLASGAVDFPLSDYRLAFTVKPSCIFWPVPVLRSRGEGGELPSSSDSSVQSWVWQMLSISCSRQNIPSFGISVHISVSENIGSFALLWILEG